MSANQLLRGILIFICAQIPLMALFIYLLFIGVGISDFAKLAVNPPNYDAILEQRNKRLLQQMNAAMDQVNQRIRNVEVQITALKSDRESTSNVSSEWNSFVKSGGPQAIGKLLKQLETMNEQLAKTDTATAANGRDVTALGQEFKRLTRTLGTLPDQVANASTDDAGQRQQINQELSQIRADLSQHVARIQTQLSQQEERTRKAISQQEEHIQAALAQQGDRIQSRLSQQEARTQALDEQTQALMSKEYPVLQTEVPKREPVAELRFGVDDWVVNHKAEWSLEKVRQEAAQLGRNAGINIYGFMAQKGPLNFSMALANKRARAVADVLRTKGIKSNPITIFVVPEYSAFRGGVSPKPGDKNNAVHIYVESP